MWDMMVDERRDHSQPIIASASTQQSTFSMTLRMDRELYFCWRQRRGEYMLWRDGFPSIFGLFLCLCFVVAL